VAMSRRLLPGLTDSGYLWMDNDHAEWVDDCAANAQRIRQEIAADLDSADTLKERQYFAMSTDWSYPARAGYWMGDLVVTRLLDSGMSPTELIGWDDETACRALARAIRAR
jgi:hypothetical protein